MTPQQAYRKVRTALKQGLLARPDKCSLCGVHDRKGTDGRSTIHAHHDDYSKPLDVQWLCSQCHRDITPLPIRLGAPVFGERNGQSKLTAVQAEEIRNSPLGCLRLSRIYNVDKKTIQRIRRRELWLAAAPYQGDGRKEEQT